MKRWQIYALLCLGINLCGCNEVRSYAGPPPVDKRVEYADVRAAVFEPFGCIKCHGTVAGYSVESRDEAAKSPKLCSYLEQGFMPPRGAVPGPELVEMVCAWVEDGAP